MTPNPTGEISCLAATPIRRGVAVKAVPGDKGDSNLAVAPCDANALAIGFVTMGTSGDDVVPRGVPRAVTVATGGIAGAKTGAAIPFGALLRTDELGRVVPIDAHDGELVHVVGQALRAADAADQFIAVRVLSFAFRV